MTDIVARLREFRGEHWDETEPHKELMHVAAEEIVRLRGIVIDSNTDIVERLQSNDVFCYDVLACVALMRKGANEIQRLRALVMANDADKLASCPTLDPRALDVGKSFSEIKAEIQTKGVRHNVE